MSNLLEIDGYGNIKLTDGYGNIIKTNGYGNIVLSNGYILTEAGSTLTEQSSPWLSVSYQNNYEDFTGSHSSSGYFKDACGMVHIRVAAKNGTAGTTIFTLPTGYRPPAIIYQWCYVDDGTSSVKNIIQITSSGIVSQPSGVGTQFLNDSITFYAEG